MNLNIPGVPALAQSVAPLLRGFGAISQISNALSQIAGFGITPIWGVFDQDGNDALKADTVVGFDYKNGSRLLDYPIEKGAFESYNKVANPFEAPFIVAKGGSIEERQAFLKVIEGMSASLDLYTLVTPEKVYASVNLERFDFSRRAANGANLLVVTLYFREIRQTAAVNGQTANAQTPDAVPVTSLGQVSPNPLASALSSAMSGAAQKLASVKAGVSNSARALIGVL